MALVVALTIVGCRFGARPSAQEASTPEPIKSSKGIIVEGRIVPRAQVTLSSAIGGKVAEVLVKEGDSVSIGQVLLRLDDGQLRAQVAEAEAGLSAARADLAKLEAGARAEELATAQAAVRSAQANLAVAESQVKSATVGIAVAEGQIARARAALADLQAGATKAELEIAQAQVKLAENDLYGAQAVRDAAGGGQPGQPSNGQAEAGIGKAYEALRIAGLQVARLQSGPRPGTVAEAQAAVQIAQAQKAQVESQREVAQAQAENAAATVRQAQAQADLVKAGARESDRQRAQAAVAQAEAALEAARLVADEALLRAPIAGTVSRLDAKIGERIMPANPVVVLADLSVWEVETKDLTEMEVVRIVQGQQVTMVPDALPEVELAGSVVAIRPAYEEKLGDVTYTVRLQLDHTDPRLRWGMTVAVNFGAP